jgi:hypothetical protein
LSPGSATARGLFSARRTLVPDLDFKVTGLVPGEHGLTPLLNFELQVNNRPEAEPIHTVILQVQIQIQSAQRRYSAQEKEKLVDLFGTPDRWGQTLRNKLFALASTTVRSFTGATTAILSVPCTYDLDVLSAKYFYALDDGDVPLLFLFSGTVFYAAEGGRLQAQQISWNKECPFRVPVSAWKELMEHHYPNSAWLSLRRDVFERLYAYRRTHGIANWDQAIEQLLPALETVNAETAP